MSKIIRKCINCGYDDNDGKPFKMVNAFLFECPACGDRPTYLVEATQSSEINQPLRDYLKEVIDYMPKDMVTPMIKLIRAFTTGKKDIVVARVNAFHKKFGSGNPDNVLIRVDAVEDPSGNKKTHEIFVNIDKNKYKTDDQSLINIANAIAVDKISNFRWVHYELIKTVMQYESKGK